MQSADDFREQLEREHEERLEAFAARKERSREKSTAREDQRSAREEQARQQELRAAFYKEKGYKKYVDSRGKTHWLLPEEYEWRRKARKQREERNRKYMNVDDPKRTKLYLWVGLVLVAMVVGMALLKG